MPESEHLLSVRDLKTQFFTRDGVVGAVNGVTFHVDRGEALGLVGESGCGKSVSALSIMGLVPKPGRVVAGQVWYGGKDQLALAESEREKIRGNEIAMVFQDPMSFLNPVMSIGQQIAEPLRLHRHMGKGAARKRALELMKLVGIPGSEQRIDNYPHQFSGGMRQRVMIAMALSCDPKLLIADEPTTALDVTIQAQILELLQRLRSDLGMALILITHDLGVVAGIVDRVNVMYAGYIVETGTVGDTFADPRHPYTLGLMASIPRVDLVRGQRLLPVQGVPPDLIDTPPGCPFEPRCPFSVPQSPKENPKLELKAPNHWAACWADVRTAQRHPPGETPAEGAPVQPAAPAGDASRNGSTGQGVPGADRTGAASGAASGSPR
jgi:oligopeptide transport system ATP-binding protein